MPKPYEERIYCKKDVDKILLDLKREIHAQATYTHGDGTCSFINLRTLDAIITNKLRELDKMTLNNLDKSL